MNIYMDKLFQDHKTPKFIVQYIKTCDCDYQNKYIVIKKFFDFMINKKRINKGFSELQDADIVFIQKVDIYQFLKSYSEKSSVNNYKECKNTLYEFYEYAIKNKIIQKNIVNNTIDIKLLYAYIVDMDFDGFERLFQITLHEFLQFERENEIETFVLMFKAQTNFVNNIDFKEAFDYESFKNSSFEEKEMDMKYILCQQKLLTFCQILKQFGDYDRVVQKIVNKHKRRFVDLKPGDTVFVFKSKKFSWKTSEDCIETKIIKSDPLNDDFQVKYNKLHFGSKDYPSIIKLGTGTVPLDYCSLDSTAYFEHVDSSYKSMWNVPFRNIDEE